MKRHAALTSTFSYMLDSIGTLSQQSLSKAHRERIKRVARGVLVAIGISLCFVPEAGSSDKSVNKTYIDYKTYSLYLLDFNYKEYYCLEMLYTKESNWRPDAKNGSHYGIPQGRSEYLATLDGWGQVRWGLDYIGHRYGEPCVALDHWKAKGWH
jgi:hypothetical protein